MEHAKRQPGGVVLVLNVEISSVGFRGHVHNTCNKLSWLINSLLFADAASAVCILGSSYASECTENQPSSIRMVQCQRNWKTGNEKNNMFCNFWQVGGRQRMVPRSADVMYFQWDQAGYHFCTTGNVCNTVTSHAPKFVSDLTQNIFGESPKALSLAIIHTGGAKIIRSLMDALKLNGSDSEALSWESMSGDNRQGILVVWIQGLLHIIFVLISGGNLSSVTVIDMLLKAWPKLMQLEAGSKVAVLGMGPGMFLEGVCLLCDRASNVQELKKRTQKAPVISSRSLLWLIYCWRMRNKTQLYSLQSKGRTNPSRHRKGTQHGNDHGTNGDIPFGVSPSDNATITAGFALCTTSMKSLEETLNRLLFDHTETVFDSLYPLLDSLT